MELTRIEDIDLNEATCELLNDVRETAHKVNEIRPLEDQVVQQVRNKLLGDRVYSSNAIEGSTLDLRETEQILKAGHVSADIEKKREATEVVNLGSAFEQSVKIDRDGIASVEQFLAVHKTLLHGINDEWAGNFRHDRVRIRAAKHQPPHHHQVRELMGRSFRILQESQDEDTVKRAAWIHWAIARIHPFFDGNGRMARLWQDLVLFHGQLTCAIIRPSDRRDYLDALQSADEADFNPITQLVAQRTAATLDIYLSEKQKVDDIEAWAAGLAKETNARTEESRRLSYMRWKRKMEELRYEFERCASKVTQVVRDIEIQFRAYQIIDESTWDMLRSGTGAAKTWFFWLRFKKGRQYFMYFFFFGKHFWSKELDNAELRSEPRVSLLVSEAEGSEAAKRLAEDSDSPVSLRELLAVDNHLVRKRFIPDEGLDSDKQQHAYDHDIDAADVARQFIEEVLLRRLT